MTGYLADGLNGTHTGIEIITLSQFDIDTSKTRPNRCRDGSFKGNFVLLKTVINLLRHKCACFLKHLQSCIVFFPNDIDIQDSDYFFHHQRDFRSDAIPRNQGDTMFMQWISHSSNTLLESKSHVHAWSLSS